MVEFKILRVCSKLSTLDFRRVDFGLLRDLLGRIPWDKALEGRGTQEIWSVFKDHLLQAQEQCIPTKRNVRQKCQEAYMDEQGAPGQIQVEKGGLQRMETRTGSLGGMQRNCPSSQGAS